VLPDGPSSRLPQAIFGQIRGTKSLSLNILELTPYLLIFYEEMRGAQNRRAAPDSAISYICVCTRTKYKVFHRGTFLYLHIYENRTFTSGPLSR